MLSTVEPTTISTLFFRVDEIKAELDQLTAQAPTYAQFSETLRRLGLQISSIAQQIAAISDQNDGALLLLQAIVDALGSIGTVRNQDQILQALTGIQQTQDQILQALSSIPGIPTQVGVDLGRIEARPQKPTQVGVDVRNVATRRQGTPTKPGP